MTKDKPCGWACRMTGDFGDKTFVGAASTGTNNFAELIPYIQALWWIDKTRSGNEKVSVRILSDSEVTVKCGSRIYDRTSNLSLWAAVDHFEATGFLILWEHTPRSSVEDNVVCDKISGMARKNLLKFIQGEASYLES